MNIEQLKTINLADHLGCVRLTIAQFDAMLNDTRVAFVNPADRAYFVVQFDEEDYVAVVCSKNLGPRGNRESYDLVHSVPFKAFAQALRYVATVYCQDCGADDDYPIEA